MLTQVNTGEGDLKLVSLSVMEGGAQGMNELRRKEERRHAAPTAGEVTLYPYLAPTLPSVKSFE
jgi:hypothetical protein